MAEFYKDGYKRGGRQGYCKECTRKSALSKHPADCQCLGCVARFIDATGLKRCPRCGEVKSIDEFYKKASGRPQSYCMDCNAKASNENRKKQADKRTDSEREQWNLARRLRKYNLTEHELIAMLDMRNGQCICGESIDIRSAYIDHDHACCDRDGSCGKCIRGVLCRCCNTALGLIKDDPNRAMALATYLMRFEHERQ